MSEHFYFQQRWFTTIVNAAKRIGSTFSATYEGGVDLGAPIAVPGNPGLLSANMNLNYQNQLG